MTYKQLFKEYKIVRQLSIVQFIAYFGAWFSNVAIYSMLVDFNASALLIASVTAVNLLPSILLAPFSGSIVDRLPVKKLMLGLLSIELTMTLSFMLINSINDIWMLFIFLFIRMGSASMFFTAEMTLMPKLVKGEALVKANELHSIIWSFTFTAGMALGGIVVNNFGYNISFLIDTSFFFVAIIILMQIKFNITDSKISEHIFKSIKDGVKFIINNKYLLKYMLLHASVGLTAFDTLVTLLADFEYKYIISVPLAIGLSNATRALALMIGPFIISSWINKDRLYYVFIAQGISIILWAMLQNNFYLGLFGMFLTGLATTTIWSYTYAMLQDKVPHIYLGRVLAYNEMFFMLSNIITTLFIGFMVNYISLFYVTMILGIIFLITAYIYKTKDF